MIGMSPTTHPILNTDLTVDQKHPSTISQRTTDMTPLDLTHTHRIWEDHHTIYHMNIMITHHTIEGIFRTEHMTDPLGGETEGDEDTGDPPEDE